MMKWTAFRSVPIWWLLGFFPIGVFLWFAGPYFYKILSSALDSNTAQRLAILSDIIELGGKAIAFVSFLWVLLRVLFKAKTRSKKLRVTNVHQRTIAQSGSLGILKKITLKAYLEAEGQHNAKYITRLDEYLRRIENVGKEDLVDLPFEIAITLGGKPTILDVGNIIYIEIRGPGGNVSSVLPDDSKAIWRCGLLKHGEHLDWFIYVHKNQLIDSEVDIDCRAPGVAIEKSTPKARQRSSARSKR